MPKRKEKKNELIIAFIYNIYSHPTFSHILTVLTIYPYKYGVKKKIIFFIGP